MRQTYNVYSYYSAFWGESWYYREDRRGRLEVRMRGNSWAETDRTLNCDMLAGKVQLIARNVRFKK